MGKFYVTVRETRVVECQYEVDADNERDAAGLAEMGDTVSSEDLSIDGVINREVVSVRAADGVS